MNEKRFIRVFWLARAVLIVVLVCVGFQAITGGWRLGSIDPAAVSGDERMPADEPPSIATRSSRDYTAILETNLFSGADDTAEFPMGGRSQNLDSMPSAEDLGLRLVGTIAGGPAISRANIQNVKNNTTGVYRIGDTVGSATIETIRQDAIVLRHNGRQLILRRQTGAAGDKQPAVKAGPQADAEKPAPAGKQNPLPPVKADYVAEVFRQATIEPYVKNNRTEGLRITGLDKIPMAEMFGLKNGDIIRTVNGQQLTSKQKAFQVLMKARTQSKIDIQLLRNGKGKDLSFDL